MEEQMLAQLPRLTLGGNTFRNVEIWEQEYEDGSPALIAYSDDGERIATLTVSLPNYPRDDPREVFIKDWSENAGAYPALMEAGVVSATLGTIAVGLAGVTAHRVLIRAT